jgi:hypothetical protein
MEALGAADGCGKRVGVRSGSVEAQHGGKRVKVKVSLCCFLIGHHAMKAYWGSGSTALLIL